MLITRQAVILVGGRGTRLGALTNNIPKPLLKVAGRPFLSYVIEFLARQEINDILLLAGYHAEAILEFTSQYTQSNLSVRCIIETTPLGTGGALVHAHDYLADNFILLNGDTLFNIDVHDFMTPLMNEHVARIALRRVSDTSRFGRIGLDGDKIVAIQEKGVNEAGLINGGMYFLAKTCLDLLPVGVASLENDLFPRLIAEQKIAGREYADFFIDIGIPSDLDAAQTLIPQLILLRN